MTVIVAAAYLRQCLAVFLPPSERTIWVRCRVPTITMGAQGRIIYTSGPGRPVYLPI